MFSKQKRELRTHKSKLIFISNNPTQMVVLKITRDFTNLIFANQSPENDISK